jgi:hypothetical protein
VAINRGWLNQGVVAIHAIDKILTYRLDPTQGAVELARIDIDPPPTFGNRGIGAPATWDALGPKFSISWTGSGKHIVAAASSGDAEFVVISASDNGQDLNIERYVTICVDPTNFPLDVFSLNGLLTPPATDTASATATPPPVASATPMLIPSSTVTALPSATVAATVTPTPTETPSPPSLYIPLILRESCIKALRRVDVVMVIDASTSMLELTSAGRSKLDAAREAALALVDELDFSAGDQGGLVIFNETVVTSVALNASGDDLEAGLAGAASAPGTCVPCGLAAAVDLLFGPEHDAASTPAIVLLTDGLSNVQPIGDALPIAEQAKASGATIFTIGLGESVEADELEQIASGPDHFFSTTDAETLKAIFQSIVVEIPCPANDFWARR